MRFTALLLTLAGLFGCACGDAKPPAGPADGAALFREQNCIQCHGPDGAGTNLGPTLHGKKQHWTREKLATYLANPQSVIQGDKRLEEQETHFMIKMVPFANLTLEQRLALADHVLGFP